MRALILNSGLGHRMGDLTKSQPKCLTALGNGETILSRQLRFLEDAGIKEVVITTGYYDEVLINYCNSLRLPLHLHFVKNPFFSRTNYIYSIYCASKMLCDDVLLMHGDLVFEPAVLQALLASEKSCMKVSSSAPLPKKDFKAVVENGRVRKIGVEFFDSAMEAQAIYKLNQKDWLVWLREIVAFCERGDTNVYAENAFNVVSDQCEIYAIDVKDLLCTEVDTPEDLLRVKELLQNE